MRYVDFRRWSTSTEVQASMSRLGRGLAVVFTVLVVTALIGWRTVEIDFPSRDEPAVDRRIPPAERESTVVERTTAPELIWMMLLAEATTLLEVWPDEMMLSWISPLIAPNVRRLLKLVRLTQGERS